MFFWNKKPEKTFDEQNASSIKNPYCEFSLTIDGDDTKEIFYLFNTMLLITGVSGVKYKFGNSGQETSITANYTKINLDQITDRIFIKNNNLFSVTITFALGVGDFSLSTENVSIANQPIYTLTYNQNSTRLQTAAYKVLTASSTQIYTPQGGDSNVELIIQNLDAQSCIISDAAAISSLKGYRLSQYQSLRLRNCDVDLWARTDTGVNMAASNLIVMPFNL